MRRPSRRWAKTPAASQRHPPLGAGLAPFGDFFFNFFTETDAMTDTTAPALELTLKYPFTSASGQRIEKLVFRRGMRGDMKAAAKYSKDEGEQESFLFARLTGLAIEDIDQLDLADAAAVTRFFLDRVVA
jgi:hypothetical protein